MRLVVLVICAACNFAPARLTQDGSTTDSSAADAPRDAMPDIAVPATCSNQVRDGNETDVDCGGSCSQCAVGLTCGTSTDCSASVCDLGACRRAKHCRELHQEQSGLADGSYTIDPDGAGGAAAFATFCDMSTDGGGWTLVGKVDGESTMYTTWLVANSNVAALATPTIASGTYACVNAIYLAVNGSSEIRLSSSTRASWVKWPLPAGRTIASWWHHAAGQATINGATQTAVSVTSSTNAVTGCFQNIYGVMPWNAHGGAYPYASFNTTGNTAGGDFCMAVGTMAVGGNADGFTQNGNSFDAPSDDVTWPNAAYGVSPHVAVWLR